MKKGSTEEREKLLTNGDFLDILQELRKTNTSYSREALVIDSPKNASSDFLAMLSRCFKNTKRDLFEFFQCHGESPCRSCCFSGFKGEAICTEKTVCSQKNGFIHSVYFEAEACPYYKQRKNINSEGAFYKYASDINLENIT
jgi:hypothetical protein